MFGLTKIGHPGSGSRFVGNGFNFTDALLSALGGCCGAYPIVLSSDTRTSLANHFNGDRCNHDGGTNRSLFLRCNGRAKTGILICHFPGLCNG